MSDGPAGAPLRRRLANPGAIGGTLALAAGVWVMIEASGYPLGTLRRMGPGYFPVLLGALLAAMGGLLALTALLSGEAGCAGEPREDDVRPDARALVAVLAGLGAFALLLPRFGLVPAVAALVVISAQGSGQMRPLGALALAVVLAALAWAIFRLGLGLPLPAFRL
jgi:hypothetical protein